MDGRAENTDTIIINLFGGPGTGKSTMAAGIFSQLKWKWVNCELVTEYAKEKVWEQSHLLLENQMYIIAKQLQRIKRLEGNVDVVVTDSPLILPILYNDDLSDHYDKLIIEIFNSYRNVNYLLLRKKEYMKKGRTQTFEEAVQLDERTRALLDDNGLFYTELPAEPGSQEIIVNLITEVLRSEGKTFKDQ